MWHTVAVPIATAIPTPIAAITVAGAEATIAATAMLGLLLPNEFVQLSADSSLSRATVLVQPELESRLRFSTSDSLVFAFRCALLLTTYYLLLTTCHLLLTEY